MAGGRETGASLSYAPEASFGSLGSNRRPDVSGLTFEPVEHELDAISLDGLEVRSQPQAQGRPGPWGIPAEPVVPQDGAGNRIEQLVGDTPVSMAVRAHGDGTQYANPTAVPLWRFLMTMLDVAPLPAAPTQAVIGPGTASVNDFEVAAGANADFRPGSLICWRHDGVVEWSRITGVAPGANTTVTISPAFSRQLDVNDTVVHCWTAFLPNTMGIPAASSVALIKAVQTYQLTATGCRAMGVNFRNENGMAYADFTMKTPWAQTAAGANTLAEFDSIAAEEAGARIALSEQSYVVLSGDRVSDGTVPGALSRTELAVEDFNVQINVGMTPVVNRETGLLMSEMERTGRPEIQASVTFDPDVLGGAAPEGMYRNREHHNLILGWGPPAEGSGFCVCLPAAHIETRPLRDLSGERQMVTAVFNAGRWALDETGGGAAENSMIAVGVPLA